MERELDWTKRVEVQDALARTPTVILFLSFQFGRVSVYLYSFVADNANIADFFEPYSLFPIVAGW